MRVRLPRIAFVFACAVSLALPLGAQSPNGTMNGRVLDPSNKVIAGADILVISDATGLQYSGKTNEDGIYVVPNLPPGAYRLQVSKLGFKTLIKPDIVLNIQDALSINFTLPVGAAFETVTVEGGASMINTTDASVSTVVDQTYVKNMPLNGRSFQDLILLTPGIVTQSPQTGAGLGQNGEFSVNGQRTESNYYSVDGVSANVGAGSGSIWTDRAGPSGSLAASTALGTTQALVSVDDLQEFRVQSSTYSAEYGRNPGGQFAFETKSGTNQWHGTVYDYLRNGYFDAQDWFNDFFGTLEPAVKQNDFGGTLGGPVDIPGLYQGKDKTFFFISYEGLRLIAPQAAVASPVPDLCMRGMGACPSGRNAAASALLPMVNAFPLPSPNGLEDAANGVGQFIGSWSNPAALDSTSVRFDHVVNDKLRLFFRFSNTISSLTARRPASTAPPTLEALNAYTLRTYTAGTSNILSNTLSNEFRINYSSNEATGGYVISPFGGSSPLDLVQLAGSGSGSDPNVYFFLGPSVFLLAQGQSKGTQSQWNLVDTVSFSSGHHQMKCGVDFRRLAPSGVQPYSPLYYFFSESVVESNSPYYGAIAFAPAYPLYRNFSVFVQDEWKVSPRLSLSLGLRWEVNPAPGVTKGLKPYTVQGSGPDTWSLAPQGTPLWQTTWYNFGPRLGAAYILRNTPGRETVMRGGGGIFFDTGQQLGSLGFDGPGFSALNVNFVTPQPFPGNPVAPLIVNPPVPPFNYAYAFAPHMQLPYTFQWNTSVEQALGNSQALTVSYIGSHASRLLQENQLTSSTNPLTTTFYTVQTGLTSDYDSLQVKFRRRLSRGLTTLASYTWSHCMDYGSANYEIGYQRGNCDFDVRHNVSAAFSDDLPNVGHGGFVDAVLHHWGLDGRLIARTAFPVLLNGAPTIDPITGIQTSTGLDLVSGQPIYLYGSNCNSVYQNINEAEGNTGTVLRCPGGRAINPCAFALPTGPQPYPASVCPTGNVVGIVPRNFARGFGAWQMNFAIRRDFPIQERLRLEFRAEAFNVFNHPNYGTINASFGQSTFGQATATLANSLGILNSLYQVGGPRSMQFALKLVF